jgi:hypothetical protein
MKIFILVCVLWPCIQPDWPAVKADWPKVKPQTEIKIVLPNSNVDEEPACADGSCNLPQRRRLFRRGN